MCLVSGKPQGKESSNLKHFLGKYYAKDPSLTAAALELLLFFPQQ